MEHTDEALDLFARWERQAWEARADGYAASLTDLTGGAARALLDAAEVGAGTTVLDVATGPGVVALAALRRGAEVTAVDQSAAMVRLARGRGVDARQARAEDLPFADGAFEAVLAGFLLNHLPRPEAGVGELARVCGTGGRVALSVWDLPEANPALGLFGPLTQELGLPEAVPPGPDGSLYAGEGRMADLLERTGLVDVEVGRVRWAVTVDPAAWFDAIAESTPRTGAVLAAAAPGERARLRQRYVEVALAGFGTGDGLATLPAAAVIGRGRKAARP